MIYRLTFNGQDYRKIDGQWYESPARVHPTGYQQWQLVSNPYQISYVVHCLCTQTPNDYY